MIRIYGIKNCDTMKKAFAWLDEHGVAYEFHDYKKAGVPVDRLEAWMKQAGWEKLVNTRGPTFRKLPPELTAGLDATRAVAVLAEHSSAIKRPVVEGGRTLLVGFDPESYAKALK
jgi:arsenate reductase